MKTLIAIFVLIFSFQGFAKEISLTDILQSFDLCSMKSSFGQLCKKDNPNKTFYEFMIDDYSPLYGASFDSGENFVTVESKDWFYRIDIISSEDNKAILEFIDDSKIGSYYAHSELEVKYNQDNKRWVVVRDKTLSLSEDAEKIFSYLQVDDNFMNKYVDLMLRYLQTGQVDQLAKERLWQNNSNKDHIKFAEWMSAFCMQAYYIQVENVKSAKLSLKNKKVTYSENYFIEVEKSSRILETMPLDPNSFIYQDFMQGFFDQMAHTDKNTKSFLLSAATGKPMEESMSGVVMTVDQSTIKQVEDNLYFLEVLAQEVINPIY
ncbi:hypothetical protein OAJ95_02015 [Pelagibacteraceae bacterium]|nr:hypothetical protein [Pelagibacteraceae bacterium]